MHRSYLITSGLIFAAVTILHFLRLINDWTFVMGPWSIPRWACLSAWALSVAFGKVVSALRQDQEPSDELAALLLLEPQGIEIRILHHEA